MASDRGRGPDDGDDPVLEAGRLDGPAEVGEGVEPAGGGVDDLGVAVQLAGLVLLGAAVVVDAEEDAAARRAPRVPR